MYVALKDLYHINHKVHRAAVSQGSFERITGTVSAVIQFYMWLFTTALGLAQRAFSAVTGEGSGVKDLWPCSSKHVQASGLSQAACVESCEVLAQQQALWGQMLDSSERSV
jgi:hypothetical protein